METCPLCGQTVTALDNHLRYFCPERNHDLVRSEEVPSQDITPEIPVGIIPAKRVDTTVAEKAELSVPPAESNFWTSPEDKSRLLHVRSVSITGSPVNVMIRGPKGSGKTTLARQYAATFETPFYTLHCGALVDPEQWIGKDRILNGETFYRKAWFIHAVETPGCTILLDELNRTHPENLNTIFPILDWQRSFWSDDLGYEVKVAPGVVFFATINEGEDYFGINPLDAALRDRFSRTLKLDYPPKAAETALLKSRGVSADVAEKLCTFARSVRDQTVPYPISTRQLQVTAEEMVSGSSMREAVFTTIINALDEPALITNILQALQLIEDEPYGEI